MVHQYMEHYNNRLDGRSFPSMRLVSDINEVHNVHTGRMHDTAICATVNNAQVSNSALVSILPHLKIGENLLESALKQGAGWN